MSNRMYKEKDKGLISLLREEDSFLKKKDLMQKLLKIMDYLWATESTRSIKRKIYPRENLNSNIKLTRSFPSYPNGFSFFF